MAVDTFLTLSGFLITYLFIKDLKKNNNAITGRKVFRYYVHRIWRLLPVMTAVVVLHGFILDPLKNGPGNVNLKVAGKSNEDGCKNYWWRNLLFIHNLFPQEQQVRLINQFDYNV